MREFIPSYKNYRYILDDIMKSHKLCDYTEAARLNEFVILRHDIEFSIERSYAISKIESEVGVNSTYFVQVTNNAYNALSKNSLDMLRDMALRGHHIGLHYNLCGQTDPLKVRDGVRDQIRILSEMSGLRIDRFSIHRPVKEVYYNQIPIDGVINAYSPEFFTLADGVNEETELEVKYIADSQHRWNYGYPDLETFRKYKKIQLLLHPDFWSESGCNSLGNFRLLIKENEERFKRTLDSECNHFSRIKNLL